MKLLHYHSMTRLLLVTLALSQPTYSQSTFLQTQGVITQDNQTYLRTSLYGLEKLAIKDEQLNPLHSIVIVAFSDKVITLGDAIRELLIGSGFRWQNLDGSNDAKLESLPVPDVLRELGPLTLKEALVTLGGSARILKVDPVSRSIWFDLKPNLTDYPTPTQPQDVNHADPNEKNF